MENLVCQSENYSYYWKKNFRKLHLINLENSLILIFQNLYKR